MKQISIQHDKRTAGIFTLLLAVFMVIAFAATAQKSYSVAVISPTSGAAMVKGQAYTLQFKVTNTGMMAINAMDTLMVEVTVNGASAMMGGTVLTMPINMGASQTFQINNFTYSNFTANNDNSNLCMSVFIPNNTNSGNGQGCQSVKLRLPAPTSIAQQTQAPVISVYPNPASAFIHVKAAQPLEGTFRLYDMSGKEMTQVTVNGTEQAIQTGSYPAGIYFYRLSDARGGLLQDGKVTVIH